MSILHRASYTLADGTQFGSVDTCPGWVFAHVSPIAITPAQARMLAAALREAADQAEKAEKDAAEKGGAS